MNAWAMVDGLSTFELWMLSWFDPCPCQYQLLVDDCGLPEVVNHCFLVNFSGSDTLSLGSNNGLANINLCTQARGRCTRSDLPPTGNITYKHFSSLGNGARRWRRTHSNLLNCFCFTKIILMASSTDMFSQVISGFVLHIKELHPVDDDNGWHHPWYIWWSYIWSNPKFYVFDHGKASCFSCR